MNYPFAFGHPHDRYTSYPLYPSPMPWNFGLNFQMPIHPQYPHPHLPFFTPQPAPNLFLSQQYNNFYALDPNYSPSNINMSSFATSSKPIVPPNPPKSQSSTTNDSSKRIRASLKQKKIDVIEVSDPSSESKKIIKKSKKGASTKEHRMFVELKRLSDKRFVKLDQSDRRNIEEQLLGMAHKIGSQVKRSKRTNERTIRQFKEQGSLGHEDQKQQRKMGTKQWCESISHNERVSILNNTEIEVVLPRILAKSEFEEQKRALKESLLIRSMQNL